MNKKYEFTSILGWSASRYDIFKLCKRQYFYHYYGKYDKDFSATKIKQLKALTTSPQEIGSITHLIIKHVLERLKQSTNKININKLNKFVTDIAIKECSTKSFFESYYNNETVDIEFIAQNVFENTKNLINSDFFRNIQSKIIQYKNTWIIDPDGYGETRIKNMKAYVKVDFLYKTKDKAVVIDWKTGKEDHQKQKKQMLAYASWAINEYKINPTNVYTALIFLKPEYKVIKYQFTSEEIEAFYMHLKTETEEMYTFLKDINNNKPLPKENFPQQTNTKLCSYCNYKELCGLQ